MKLKTKYSHKKDIEDEFSKLLKKNIKKGLAKINKPSPHKIYNSNLKSNTNYKKLDLRCPTILKSVSYQKEQNSAYTLMNYILKNAKSLENETGDTIRANNVNKECNRFALLKNSENKVANNKDKLSKRQIAHLVFSLPNNLDSNEKILKETLREILPEVFLGHKYIFAIHKNTNNMHAHIAIKCKNDLEKKQLKLNGYKLLKINKMIHDKCLEKQVYMKKTIIINGKEYDNTFKKKAPNFLKIDSLLEIDQNNHNQIILNAFEKKTQKNNKTTEEQLDNQLIVANSIKIQLPPMEEIDKKRFLLLYSENSSFALQVLNKNPEFFNITVETFKKYKELNDIKYIKINKYPDFMYKTVPNFIGKDITKNLDKLTASKNVLDNLEELGMDQDNIQRFLNLYQEDNKLAISTLNNNPRFFNLNKEKINQYIKTKNIKYISFRKLNIKNINENTQKIQPTDSKITETEVN